MSIPSHLQDDHVPERMKVPGFLNALPYKAIGADVPYVCAYDWTTVDNDRPRHEGPADA